jgi:hypothetical protein
MGSFWTGFFTLFAALGAVWLKDYLDRRKTFHLTTRQKAIEAYSLSNSLIHTLNAKEVICINLLRDHSYKYWEMLNNFPDTMSEHMERLELLIVDNFYDLNADFLKVKKIMIDRASFLLAIITAPKNDKLSKESNDFENVKSKFQTDIIKATSILQDKLNIQYINKKVTHPNVFDYFAKVYDFLRQFFNNTKA